ncbi:CBS domain-containing protein [Alphaproteobacteria bacterium GH1-50]|uniref:CBS domain-containing protein n=1 Tax=Kangsaoukella pontilimi TaxID=2691042 RepID=A0A7C9IHR1_9RHOB|nr:CBS domain-containing protein [Kangsaoukella pontilimi]MXQ09248.1 CBS domain-containing protein [Kangsaoukella pontilimi]
MTEYRVGAIMRADIPTMTPATPIRRAVAVMVDAKAAAAPVLGDDGRLVGILTQKDCFRPALHASYHREWSGTVGDHMSPEVVTVSVEDEVIRVAELFLKHPHRVFPVLDGARVVGLVHRSDVLAVLTRLG